MKYLVRTAEGREYGPVDQETLEQWVDDGRITESTKIRNEMMKTWSDAPSVPFLKAKLESRLPKKEDEAANKLQSGPIDAVTTLNKSGVFKYVPANPIQRSMASLIDLGMAFILFVVLYGAMPYMTTQENFKVMFMLNVVITFGIYLLYMTFSMGFTAQTLGQYYWGIMIIRDDGQAALLFRCFLFSLLDILLLPLSPLIIITPRFRALQDTISRVRIIKITLRDL